jgi:hypothetical protein
MDPGYHGSVQSIQEQPTMDDHAARIAQLHDALRRASADWRDRQISVREWIVLQSWIMAEMERLDDPGEAHAAELQRITCDLEWPDDKARDTIRKMQSRYDF